MAKYLYRNTKTGATFASDVVCSGGNWEQISSEPEKQEPAEPEQTKKDKKASK